MPTPISMPPYLGDYLADSTVPVFWNAFGTGLIPVTIAGLAVTDIEIYKNSSMTQRASDSGYTLIDTDGVDIDGVTGCHGVSIDLSDNSDSGFFARGNDYMVMVNAVTVEGVAVQFCAAVFSIENRAGRNGVGDYEVTLTVRTTAGTPLAGVSVWVNSSNIRSGSVAGTKVTDTNGQVVFNLKYTTYYIFCNLSGYTFASASFTAAAGSVSFTKDIAAATVSGSSSFYADSFLSRAIIDVHEATDEPTQKAKYTSARVIAHLEKSYILILNEINRNSRTPAVGKITKTLASGTNTYVLPHTVGSVFGIYKADSVGGKVFYDSRSQYNVFGKGLWLENQTLHIQAVDTYGIGTEITIEYTPSGIARLHNGVCTLNAAGDVVTFGATPNAGVLDTHHEAYTGCIFRHLGVDGTTVTGNFLQERVITAYDETTREATLDAPLSPIPTTDDGYIYYEIAPTISKGMDTVVALYAAYRLTSGEGNTKRANGILKLYRNELRNVRLSSYYSLMPDAPVDRSDSFDNRRYNNF
jgi:hypothetical protein